MNEKRAMQPGRVMETVSLSAVDLFQGLPASCLQELDERSKAVEYRTGHLFFQPGETGDVLFILEKGAVQTFRKLGRKKLIIAELKPPAVFGEMGCVGQGMYHCSAQTTEASRIRSMMRADLEALLEHHPTITRRLLELVSQRFLQVLKDLESTSFRQLIPRLANLLLERAHGDRVQNLTHREMAEHLRVYRESATAALGELKKAGIIDIERKQIRILHRPRLERAAGE